MHMFFIFLLPFCFALTSCLARDQGCQAGYKAINSYAKKMHKTEKWDLRSIGGFFDNNIGSLALSFTAYKEVDVAEARRMIVDGIENFLISVNQNEKTRHLLTHYPFTYNDIDFGIVFEPEKEGLVVHTAIVNNEICYWTVDPQKEGNNHVILHSEPYEEAYKIVMGKELPQAAVEKEPS